MFDAVSSVVTSTTHPCEDRLAALSVLLRYFDGTYAPAEAWLPADTMASVLAQVADSPPQRDGARPLPDDVRARIAKELARITSSDADTIFPRVVRRLRQVLAYADPATTPVTAGTVTLTAGCRGKVTARSTADIALPIEVGVLGTTFVYRGGIARGTAKRPAEIPFSFPPGVVVATLGGREIARLTERDAPCPPDPR
ncbi:MAG TPA: hypothetical protein VJT85_11805 [Gemmatimonadaceae bacterium]|nr:hypothetical protein [Gemmatimonadaceae bacterium]